MQYYIYLNGQSVGPMTAEQMKAYPVNSDTQVSKNGSPWAPLYTYPELMQAIQSGSGAQLASDKEVSSKKTLCGIFAILLGYLGIQYFILGKTAGGFLTILLSIVTCGLWGIVTFIQGIMMLCMSDSEFKNKFIDSTSTLPLF